MLNKVLSQSLRGEFSLSEISMHDRVEEMEFHFPIKKGQFSQLIESLPQAHYCPAIYRELGLRNSFWKLNRRVFSKG